MIGDRAVNIIVAMWIKCDSVTKVAHKILLKVACDHGLKWVYESVNKPPEHAQCILDATIKADVKDLAMEIKLHRLMTEGDNLPMPPLKCIIPKVCCEWNG